MADLQEDAWLASILTKQTFDSRYSSDLRFDPVQLINPIGGLGQRS